MSADKQGQTGDTNMHIDLQYTAQLRIKAVHYPESKLHDHRGWHLQSAAFDQSLQNVVHRAANKQREELCECVFLDGFFFYYLVRSSQKTKTFNIQEIIFTINKSAGFFFILSLKKKSQNFACKKFPEPNVTF